MGKFKRVLKCLLFPHTAIFVILVPFATVFVIYSLAFGSPTDVRTYISYFLSAYALIILCARAPKLFKSAGNFKNNNKYLNMYFSDVHLRMKFSLYRSLGINTLYALLQLVLGFYHHSVWFYSLSGYYVLLALMRFFLLKDVRNTELGTNRFRELLLYRLCGVLLLLVNIALGVITTYIVWQNRGFKHNEIITIAMAAYTFYSMTIAIINVFKYRRYESPVMSAAKTISLAAALVSMLSLETAMLTAFGSGDSPQFRQIMTGATSGAVCLLVFSLAIYMIIHSTKEIIMIKKGVNTNE